MNLNINTISVILCFSKSRKNLHFFFLSTHLTIVFCASQILPSSIYMQNPNVDSLYLARVLNLQIILNGHTSAYYDFSFFAFIPHTIIRQVITLFMFFRKDFKFYTGSDQSVKSKLFSPIGSKSTETGPENFRKLVHKIYPSQ